MLRSDRIRPSQGLIVRSSDEHCSVTFQRGDGDFIACGQTKHLVMDRFRHLWRCCNEDGASLDVMLGLRDQISGDKGRIARFAYDDSFGWSSEHVNGTIEGH